MESIKELLEMHPKDTYASIIIEFNRYRTGILKTEYGYYNDKVGKHKKFTNLTDLKSYVRGSLNKSPADTVEQVESFLEGETK